MDGDGSAAGGGGGGASASPGEVATAFATTESSSLPSAGAGPAATPPPPPPPSPPPAGSADDTRRRTTAPNANGDGDGGPDGGDDGINERRRSSGGVAGEEGGGGAASAAVGRELSLSELLYSASSYHAIAKPVTLTMILAALSVVFVNTEETIRRGEAELSAAYAVWNTNEEEDGAGKTLGLSLANSLVIVCVITAMTFLIVLLYKFRCMKCLIGYMIFSSAALLGLLGGIMFRVAIDKYRLPVDQFTYYFTMYNFAIVGPVAIFFQKGVPTYITQGYLIATSVILAWQLSHFDEWMTWSLLVVLALYDLCAVLTPCGPLKALVNLMSQDDAPEMPGLLYEASLPSGVHRPGRGRGGERGGDGDGGQDRSMRDVDRGSRRSTRGDEGEGGGAAVTNDGAIRRREDDDGPSAPEPTSPASPARRDNAAGNVEGAAVVAPPQGGGIELLPTADGSAAAAPPSAVGDGKGVPDSPVRADAPGGPASPAATGPTVRPSVEGTATAPAAEEDGGGDIVSIPFAIARIFKLPLVAPLEDLRRPSVLPLLEDDSSVIDGGGGPTSPAPPATPREYSPEQLRSIVDVVLPRNGGRIERSLTLRDGEPQYVVTDRNGNVKMTLVVDSRGKVYKVRTTRRADDGNDEDDDGEEHGNSIRLGLGDFIFYSVLVAKAAMYSFTTFAACMLVILAGLGSTLVLLSVFRQALPALPISIFAGVIFYLLTRLVIEPWIEDLLTTPFYV